MKFNKKEESKILNILNRDTLATMYFLYDFEVGKKIGNSPYTNSICIYKDTEDGLWTIRFGRVENKENLPEYLKYPNVLSAAVDFISVFNEDPKLVGESIVKLLNDVAAAIPKVNYEPIYDLTSDEEQVIDIYKDNLSKGYIVASEKISFKNTRLCDLDDDVIFNFYKISDHFWGINIAKDTDFGLETLVSGTPSIFEVLDVLTNMNDDTYENSVTIVNEEKIKKGTKVKVRKRVTK